MTPPPPSYAASTSASARRARPLAGDFFGPADKAPVPTKPPSKAPPRRKSPRLRSSSPPSAPSSQTAAPLPIACPICPAFKGADIFQHLRRTHPTHPFLPTDFPDGLVETCAICGAAHRPGQTAHTLHQKVCLGPTIQMKYRREGRALKDTKGRILRPSPGSSQPLTRTTSLPSPSPALPRSRTATPQHPAASPITTTTSRIHRGTSTPLDSPRTGETREPAHTQPTPTRAASIDNYGLPPALITNAPPSHDTPPPAEPAERPEPAVHPAPTSPQERPQSPLPASPRQRQPLIEASAPPHTTAARPFLSHTMADLAALPGSLKHLHPNLVAPLAACAAGLAENYNTNPSDENLFYILAMVKVGLVPQMRNGHAAVVQHLSSYPNVPWPEPPTKGQKSTRSATARAKELVESGLISKAERTLSNDAKVAPLTEETIAALRSKHPEGSANPFQLPLPPRHVLPTVPEDDDISRALKSFRPDTSPGPSGWSVKLITLSATSAQFRSFLSSLTADIACGTALGGEHLNTARLTPLLKPDGGVRPIAVGELFYRLAMKAIFSTNFEPELLSAHQFGVGSKGGVEPIVHAIQRAVDQHPSFPYTHIVSLDARNAFNALFRTHLSRALRKHAPAFLPLATWAYNTPSPLVVYADGITHLLESSEGVRQGDPMGPLLFSIAIRDVVDGLQELLGPRHLVMAYLDDIFILAPDGEGLAKAVEYFGRDDSPLSLNVSKCKQVALEELARGGMEVLGSCVGSRETRAKFLQEKTETLRTNIAKIHSLPKQHALLILRQSQQQKLRHLQRTLKTDDISHLWEELDELLWSAFDRIRGCSAPQSVANRDRTIISLPPSLGGVGISSHRECAPLAYQAASALATAALLPLIPTLDDQIQPVSQRELCKDAHTIKHKNLMGTLHLRDRVTMVESASQLGRKWLIAIPSAARFAIPNDAVQSNLCYRTLLPGYTGRCRRCPQQNTLGHDECCAKRHDIRVARHEAVKHRLAGGLRSITGATVVVEPYIETHLNRKNDIRVRLDNNALPDEGSGERPLILEEYDLKIISLYASTHQDSLRTNGRTRGEKEEAAAAEREGRWAEDAERRALKVLRQQAGRKRRALPEGQAGRAPFCPLVMSSGGLQDEEMMAKLRDWKGWRMPGVSYSWMMVGIAVALVKARGKSFLAA